MAGGEGSDLFVAAPGARSSEFKGERGPDDISATNEGDEIDGGMDGDLIEAQQGSDVAEGGAGGDDVFGNEGDDVLRSRPRRQGLGLRR